MIANIPDKLIDITHFNLLLPTLFASDTIIIPLAVDIKQLKKINY